MFMIQCKYEQTKTWYLEAESEDHARAVYESADLEHEHDPAIETSHGKLQAVVPVDGPITKSMRAKVVDVRVPFDFDAA